MKRKTLTLLLALALVVASIAPIQKASAAAKLSKTSVTLYVGKTTTIKLSGGNAKWSVKNTKIKILKQTKKSAKIQAMKKGTTYLYAKVGNKKLKCKVVCKVSSSSSSTSKTKFSASKARANIDRTKYESNGQIYIELESNYKEPTSVKATCNFINSSGQVIDYKSDTVSYLEKGHTAYLTFDDCDKEYKKTEIKYEFSAGLEYLYHDSVISKLKLTHTYIQDEYYPYIMLTYTNGGKKDCYYGEAYVVYYDKDDDIVAVSTESFSVKGGSSENRKAYIPYNAITYDDIEYDHYKAFIGWAYHLGK